ncbi:MAG: IS30 family transposase [Acidobacteriota bacterium]
MHKQFSKESRIELAALLKAGHSRRECANQLGMDKPAVTKEINRNSDVDGVYRGARAHRTYLERRKNAKQTSRKIENNTSLRRHIRKRLKKRDSPEQIAGRNTVGQKHQSISTETIYQWIFNQEPHLKKHLRRIGTKGKYRRRRGTKKREKQREEGKIKRIDTRPEVVERKERIGDYEGDTIIGKDKTKRLLTNVDRFSGYGMIDKLDLVRANVLQEKLTKRFQRIPKSKKHTYTYDNGTEIGKEDRDLEKKMKMEIYRAYPYHSWERGCNENYNGLVRDFFPKGTDFATISEKEVKRVERNLNHRPRKRLGFLTPHEVYMLQMTPGAIQTGM